MRVEPRQSLSWNLERFRITTQPDPANENKRTWFRDGVCLGSFDAVDGWTMLAVINAGGPDWDGRLTPAS